MKKLSIMWSITTTTITSKTLMTRRNH